MTKPSELSPEAFKAWNDQMAEKYNPDDYHRSGNVVVRWIERTRVKKILQFLQSTPSHRVLEVGVGAGNILAMVPAGERWGLDLSAPLLALARKRLPEATLLEGNAERFPDAIPSGHFDRVYCSEVLEHIQHPKAVVQEMARVLKPDGIVVISVPNERVINTLKGFLQRLGMFRFLFPHLSTKMDDEWHLHAFDVALLRETVAGILTIEEVAAVPFFWLPIRLVARLRK